MGAHKNYSYLVDTALLERLSKLNQESSTHRFSILDANILSLIKSFHKSQTEFYMSNIELSHIMLANPSTIQRSIDRLIKAKLIDKKTGHKGKQNLRILLYKADE